MKKICMVSLVLLMCFSLYGCLFIFGGAVGAVGAYAVSKDTVQIDTDKSYESAWDASMAVARIKGTIKEEDLTNGVIKARISGSFVWITLVRISTTTTRIKVSVRKNRFPNLALAQELLLKIVEEIK